MGEAVDSVVAVAAPHEDEADPLAAVAPEEGSADPVDSLAAAVVVDSQEVDAVAVDVDEAVTEHIVFGSIIEDHSISSTRLGRAASFHRIADPGLTIVSRYHDHSTAFGSWPGIFCNMSNIRRRVGHSLRRVQRLSFVFKSNSHLIVRESLVNVLVRFRRPEALFPLNCNANLIVAYQWPKACRLTS